jgi:hypothetical protein
MKLNEIESRIDRIKNYLNIIEKCIELKKNGNKHCLCDKQCDYRTYEECNNHTIDIFKKSILDAVNTMYSAYYK